MIPDWFWEVGKMIPCNLLKLDLNNESKYLDLLRSVPSQTALKLLTQIDHNSQNNHLLKVNSAFLPVRSWSPPRCPLDNR